MHRRNRLYVTIGLIYGLLGGLLALVRLIAPTLMPGNAPLAHAHMMLLGFVLILDLYYDLDYVWVRRNGDGIYTMSD